MTNGEKYKTAKEQVKAFSRMCKPIVGHCGVRCKMTEPDEHGGFNAMICFSNWLDLEAEEEKPMNCPFCQSKTYVYSYDSVGGEEMYRVNCGECSYETKSYYNRDEAIAEHNKRCKAWLAYKESEVKND